MGLLELKLKKEIELLKAKIGTLESSQVSLRSWLSLAEAKVKELKDYAKVSFNKECAEYLRFDAEIKELKEELSQKKCSVFHHDDLIDQNQKLRNLLRQSQPSEQEAPTLFHQIKDVLKDNNSFTSKDKDELEEENRLVSEQNKDLNDALIANEKELSERISGEELVKMQEEHYISWLSEKEARIHWAELWKKASMALIGEQEKVKTQATRIAELEGDVAEAKNRIAPLVFLCRQDLERAEKAEASVVELREALTRIARNREIEPKTIYMDYEQKMKAISIAKEALASSTDAGKIKARWVAEAKEEGIIEGVARVWGAIMAFRNSLSFQEFDKWLVNELNSALLRASKDKAEDERLTSEDKGGDDE